MPNKELLQLAQLFALGSSGISGGRNPLANQLSQSIIPSALEGAIQEEIKKEQEKRKKAGIGETLGSVAGSIAGSFLPIPGGTQIGETAGATLGSALAGGDAGETFKSHAAQNAAGFGIDALGSRLSAQTPEQLRRAELQQEISGIQALESPGIDDEIRFSQLNTELKGLPEASRGVRLRQEAGRSLQTAQPRLLSALQDATSQPTPIQVGSTFGLRPEQVQNVNQQVQQIQAEEVQRIERRRAEVARGLEREQDFAQEVKLVDLQAKNATKLQQLRETAAEGRLDRSIVAEMERLEAQQEATRAENTKNRMVDIEGIRSDERIAAERNAASIQAAGIGASATLAASAQEQERFRQTQAANILEDYSKQLAEGLIDPSRLDQITLQKLQSVGFSAEEADRKLNFNVIKPTAEEIAAAQARQPQAQAQPQITQPSITQAPPAQVKRVAPPTALQRDRQLGRTRLSPEAVEEKIVGQDAFANKIIDIGKLFPLQGPNLTQTPRKPLRLNESFNALRNR